MSIKEIEHSGLARRNAIKNAMLRGDSQVMKFYDDSNVLITGGSGFIGKNLIEKLIRSSNVKKIYVLLRQKKDKTIHDRLKLMLEDPIYEYLHQEQPNFVKKLIPIEGDTSELKLGIDEKTWSMITQEVNIIFNAAASINFRETIKVATLTNIRGTREVVNLAKASKNLMVLVHVSTAYAHAIKSRMNKDIKEDFYKSPLVPETLIELVEKLDEDKLTAITAPAMKDWPNSYTFTKTIAEEVIRIEGHGLPVCIVRPAIVVGAYREPKPGWIDEKNVFGPSGIIVGFCLGVVHTLHCKDDGFLECVPVDIVNNAIIVSAYETHEKYTKGQRDIKIYTISSGSNTITCKDISDTLRKESANKNEMIPSKAIWYFFSLETKYKYLYHILDTIFHFIPALIVDGLCLLTNRKTSLAQLSAINFVPQTFVASLDMFVMVNCLGAILVFTCFRMPYPALNGFLKIYKTAKNLSSVLTFYAHINWYFECNNIRELYKKLSETDKIIYHCDMSAVDKKEMLHVWFYGVIKYIIKEDFKNHAYALKKQFYFKIATYFLLPTYLYSLYKLAFFILSLLCKSTFSIVSLIGMLLK